MFLGECGVGSMVRAGEVALRLQYRVFPSFGRTREWQGLPRKNGDQVNRRSLIEKTFGERLEHFSLIGARVHTDLGARRSDNFRQECLSWAAASSYHFGIPTLIASSRELLCHT